MICTVAVPTRLTRGDAFGAVAGVAANSRGKSDITAK